MPDQMPGQVNLPVILWLRNLVKAYDLKKYGQMRYNLLGNGGHWFPGQGAENVDEVTLVKALGERPWAGRIVAILRETHEMLKKEKVSRLSKSEGAG